MWGNEFVHLQLYKQFCEAINKNKHVHSIKEQHDKINFHSVFTHVIR